MFGYIISEQHNQYVQRIVTGVFIFHNALLFSTAGNVLLLPNSAHSSDAGIVASCKTLQRNRLYGVDLNN